MFYERKKVYDIILRLCHAAMALACVVLLLTAWGAEFYFEEGLYRKALWVSHIFAGYLFSVSLVLRILWGFVGPHHARLSQLFQFQKWLQIVKNRKAAIRWDWGHHPQASLTYVLFYIAALILMVTGFFLAGIEHYQGFLAQQLFDDMSYQPWMSNIHEFLSWTIVIFIVAHLGALFLHEKNDGIPVIQSMFSGYQYKKIKEEQNEKQN